LSVLWIRLQHYRAGCRGEMSVSEKSEVDGRTLRGERNRQALLNAALQMLEEGNLAPSAQEIAQRAGVGLRGVFRHFGDMEGLFVATEELLRDRGAARFTGGNREGSFRERLLHAVETHAHAYEEECNVFLATQAQRWRSAHLRKSYDRSNRQLRRDLEDWLPELETLPAHRREAVDAAASFETWNRLREHQHQSVEATIDIVYDTLKVLITQP
jgi:AcrR family transcriptional regulator